MEITTGPRFVWFQAHGSPFWYVYDTNPPNGDAAQAVEFASTRTQEAAAMICLALNSDTGDVSRG